MSGDVFSLDVERARTDDLIRTIGSTYVPLAVAAAITFHQAHGNTKAIVSLQDYEDALGIAAAALSRLVTIYTLTDPRENRIAVTVDLVKQRFARGATELRARDGTVVRELSIQRSDLDSAISLIKRVGLPLSFVLEGAPAAQAAEGEQKRSTLGTQR
jgi:hypothetical protein